MVAITLKESLSLTDSVQNSVQVQDILQSILMYLGKLFS